MPPVRSILRTAFCLWLAAPAAPAASPEEIGRLWDALEMPAVIAVMREEGLDYGASLDADMLEGSGGARFAAAVSAVYDTARMEADSRQVFARELAGADLTVALAFFGGKTGSRAIRAELEARRAMLDPEVDRAARETATELQEDGDPRWDLLRRFAEVNDLVDANVAGAMNANYAFFQGMAEAGALGPEMDEAAIIEEVWSQEAAVREDTESWVMGFLALSYQGLSDAELGAYTDFSASAAGHELNRALFRASDVMFLEISRRLGRAVAAELVGAEL